MRSDTSAMHCGAVVNGIACAVDKPWWRVSELRISMLKLCALLLVALSLIASNQAIGQTVGNTSSTAKKIEPAVLVQILNLILTDDEEEVKVVAPKLVLGQSNISVPLGGMTRNTITGLGGQGSLRFTSLNPLVASVNRQTGLITGIAFGTTRIEVFRLNSSGFRNSDVESFLVTVGTPQAQPELTITENPLVLEIDQSLLNQPGGGAGSGQFGFASADPSIASVDSITGLVTGVSAGTTTITVTRSGDNQFLAATPISYQVIVNRLAQPALSILENPLVLNVGQSLANPASGGGGSSAISYASSDPSIAIVDPSSGIVTGISEGITTITVTRPGDADFLDASPLNYSVEVRRQAQEPLEVLENPIALLVDETRLVLDVVIGGSGDGAFNFLSADPSVATIDPITGLITAISGGNTVITVTRAGNAEFLDGPPLQIGIEVERLEQVPLTTTFNPLVLKIDESETNEINGGSGDGAFGFTSADPSIATVDSVTGLVTGVAAGSTTITVTRAGNDRFLDAVPIAFVVQVNQLEQAPLVALFDPLILDIDQSASNDITGGSGDGAFGFTSADPSIATVDSVTGLVTGVAAGNTTITVTRAGNDRFLDAVPISFSVQVNQLEQAPLVALLDPLILDIDQSASNDITGGSGDGAFGFTSTDPSIATVDPVTGLVTGVAAGSTTITVTRAGNDRFLEAVPISFSVQVNQLEQAPLVALFDPLVLDIDQSASNDITGGSGDGAFGFTSADPSIATVDSVTGLVTGVAAGSTTITVTRGGNDRFLDAVPIAFVVQVNQLEQAPLVALFDPLILDIDQSASNDITGGSGDGAFTFTSETPAIATVNNSSGLVTGVSEGSTTINVFRSGDARFLDAIPISFVVEVNRLEQPPLSVDFDPLIIEIGQSAINPLNGGAGTGLLNFESADTAIATVDSSTGLVTGFAEGTTTITVSRAGDSRFLDADPISYQVEVNRIPQPPLSADIDPLVLDIGQSLTNIISGGAGTGELNFVSADTNIATVSSRSGVVTGVNEGNTTITVSRIGDSDFLDAAPITYDVIVNRLEQADLAVSLDPLLIEIGQSINNSATGGSGTGAFSYVSDDPSIATVDAVSGVVTGVAAGGSPGETTLGITTVTVFRAGDTQFLDATPLSFSVQVSRVAQPPLFVSSDPLILEIGESQSNISGGAGGGSLIEVDVIGEEVASFDPFTEEVSGLSAGNAIITVGREGSDVFLDAVPISFDVIVNQLNQSPLVFAQSQLTLMEGESSSNVATGGDSSNNIEYSSADPAIASVDPNTGTVTGVAIGSTTITATRLGDETFLDAVPVSYPVTVVIMDCNWDDSNWDECAWQAVPE